MNKLDNGSRNVCDWTCIKHFVGCVIFWGQWMTAGRGIVHSEMPEGEGPNTGLQLWINLARKDKMYVFFLIPLHNLG